MWRRGLLCIYHLQQKNNTNVSGGWKAAEALRSGALLVVKVLVARRLPEVAPPLLRAQ